MNASTAAQSGRVVSFGAVLLRLAAPAGEVLLQNLKLEPSICGAEANVAVALAGFGHARGWSRHCRPILLDRQRAARCTVSG